MGSLEEELPGLSGGKRLSRGAADLGLRTGNGASDRIGTGKGQRGGQDRGQGGALREAVAVEEIRRENPVDRPYRLGVHRRPPVGRDADGGQVERAEVVAQGDQLVDGGDEEKGRGPVPGDERQHLPGAVFPLEDHRGSAGEKRHQLGVQGGDVEQGKVDETDVVLPVSQRGPARADVEEGVPVRDHGPLRKPGRSRRVQKDRHVIGGAFLRRTGRFPVHGLPERNRPFALPVDQDPRGDAPGSFPGNDLPELLPRRDHRGGGAVREDVSDFRGRQPVVDGNGDGRRRNRPEIGDDELRHVRKKDRDPVSRPDPAGGEERGKDADVFLQAGVCDLPFRGDVDRHLAPPFPCLSAEDPGKRPERGKDCVFPCLHRRSFTASRR